MGKDKQVRFIETVGKDKEVKTSKVCLDIWLRQTSKVYLDK